MAILEVHSKIVIIKLVAQVRGKSRTPENPKEDLEEDRSKRSSLPDTLPKLGNLIIIDGICENEKQCTIKELYEDSTKKIEKATQTSPRIKEVCNKRSWDIAEEPSKKSSKKR